MSKRNCDCMATVSGFEFPRNALKVGADRTFRDEQAARDLFIAVSLRGEDQDFPLPARERIRFAALRCSI